MKTERYQLHFAGPFHAKPYCIMAYVQYGMSGECGFWQQVSPHYQYEKNARNWARRNNKILEN